jgi:hypothetical protein
VYNADPAHPICDIRSQIQNSQGGENYSFFNYNDHIMLAYNNYLVFSTTDTFIGNLDFDGIGYSYDWEDIIGEALDFSASIWTDGANSTANFPEPDYYGQGGFAFLSLDDSLMDSISQQSFASGRIEFQLSSLGDNDDAGSGDGADCYHRDLNFWVEVDLAQ